MARRKLSLPMLLEGYELYCRTGGLSPRTTEWYLQKLRYFVQYLKDEGFPLSPSQLRPEHIRESPMRLVRTPRDPQKVMPTFTPDQLKALLRTTDATRTPSRDKAIVLLETGIPRWLCCNWDVCPVSVGLA